MMQASLGGIILQLPGWDKSHGIERERVWFLENDLPIQYLAIHPFRLHTFPDD